MTDSEADRASVRVVELVADRRDADPLDLQPLGEVVDPDALDSLVETLDGDEYVRFAYDGLLLFVWGDGEVTVEED